MVITIIEQIKRSDMLIERKKELSPPQKGNVLAKKTEYFAARRTEQKNRLDWIRKYSYPYRVFCALLFGNISYKGAFYSRPSCKSAL